MAHETNFHYLQRRLATKAIAIFYLFLFISGIKCVENKLYESCQQLSLFRIWFIANYEYNWHKMKENILGLICVIYVFDTVQHGKKSAELKYSPRN
jgi:hypothetical protein